MLAIAGLVPHEVPGEWGGWLEIDGRSTVETRHEQIAALVGIVFQDPGSQLVMDRAEDDVAFGLENRAWPRDAMRRRVPEALAVVGLDGFERRHPTHLSGGEQQRLALAGVLAPRPGILLFDEPTANLDPRGTASFFERLADLHASRATTIVLVEHRVDRAWPLADRLLAISRDGTPIDVGAPGEVLARSGDRMEAEGIWLPRARPPAAAPTEVLPPTGPSAAVAREVVRAERVSFGYDPRRPVVRDVDLAIGAGERTALVGPNGSGKSTLGRLLVGLLRPDRGHVRLGRADPARLRAAGLARRAGYVFQDPEQQFLARTVGEEVMLALDPREREAAPALMEALGLPLERFGERSPYRLSGGEKRRLSLASVLVRRPDLLVLDEPTFGQDRRGYEALLTILRERVGEGAAVLAATHDERFVADFARRTVAIEAGRLVAQPEGAVA